MEIHPTMATDLLLLRMSLYNSTSWVSTSTEKTIPILGIILLKHLTVESILWHLIHIFNSWMCSVNHSGLGGKLKSSGLSHMILVKLKNPLLYMLYMCNGSSCPIKDLIIKEKPIRWFQYWQILEDYQSLY